MSPKATIPYSVIIEKKLLPVEKVIRVLREAGFINISEYMIRRYLTIGILDKLRMGMPSIARPRARYESYFSREQILAIAEIRVKLGMGSKLDTLLEDSNAQRKKLIILRKINFDIRKLAFDAVPYIDKCLNSKIDRGSHSWKSAKKLVSMVERIQKREKEILSATLGDNLDPSIVRKIDAFLENEFG